MRAFFLILLSLFSVHAHANSIWHVSGPKDFYLFGTIHILKPSSFPLPQVYEQTLDKCDALWLEIDSNELKDPAVLADIQAMMMLPAGELLKDQVTAKSYDSLKQLAAKANVPLLLLEGFKPWAAANQLSLIIFQNNGFSGIGLDTYLHEQADSKNIPVKAFETALWQMNMFDELSIEHADDFVSFSTEDLDNLEGMIQELYDSWKTGNYQQLYKTAQFDQYPEVEAAMLENRNNNWMNTLLNLKSKDTNCVAVGGLHMAAEHGLIAQFKKAGYSVKKLGE